MFKDMQNEESYVSRLRNLVNFYNKTLQVSSITEANGIGTYWRCFHWGFPLSINYWFKINRWLSFTFTFHSSHQIFFFFGFSFLKTWSLRRCMKMNGLDRLYYDESFTISENMWKYSSKSIWIQWMNSIFNLKYLHKWIPKNFML